ncbi:MAG: glycine zipper domain-containing protein [Verrucomicrobiota bacterium]
MRKQITLLLCCAALGFGTIGCTGIDPNSKTTQSAAVGTVAGGILGGVIGNQSGNATTGAVIGALAGGATGGYLGNEAEKDDVREARLRELERREAARNGYNY